MVPKFTLVTNIRSGLAVPSFASNSIGSSYVQRSSYSGRDGMERRIAQTARRFGNAQDPGRRSQPRYCALKLSGWLVGRPAVSIACRNCCEIRQWKPPLRTSPSAWRTLAAAEPSYFSPAKLPDLRDLAGDILTKTKTVNSNSSLKLRLFMRAQVRDSRSFPAMPMFFLRRFRRRVGLESSS